MNSKILSLVALCSLLSTVSLFGAKFINEVQNAYDDNILIISFRSPLSLRSRSDIVFQRDAEAQSWIAHWELDTVYDLEKPFQIDKNRNDMLMVIVGGKDPQYLKPFAEGPNYRLVVTEDGRARLQ